MAAGVVGHPALPLVPQGHPCPIRRRRNGRLALAPAEGLQAGVVDRQAVASFPRGPGAVPAPGGVRKAKPPVWFPKGTKALGSGSTGLERPLSGSKAERLG